MSETMRKRGMGWLPDWPDVRDFTPAHDEVTTRLKALGQLGEVQRF